VHHPRRLDVRPEVTRDNMVGYLMSCHDDGASGFRPKRADASKLVQLKLTLSFKAIQTSKSAVTLFIPTRWSEVQILSPR
jgi:hypothetical protein